MQNERGTVSIQIAALTICEQLIKQMSENMPATRQALNTYNNHLAIETVRKRIIMIVPINILTILGLLALEIASYCTDDYNDEFSYAKYAGMGLMTILALYVIKTILTGKSKFAGLNHDQQKVVKCHGAMTTSLSQQLGNEIADHSLITLTKRKLEESGKRLSGFSTINDAREALTTTTIAMDQASFLIKLKTTNSPSRDGKKVASQVNSTRVTMSALQHELNWQHARAIGITAAKLPLLLIIPLGIMITTLLPIGNNDIARYGSIPAIFVSAVLGILFKKCLDGIPLTPTKPTITAFYNELIQLKTYLREFFPDNNDRKLIELVLHELDPYRVYTSSPANNKMALKEIGLAMSQAEVYLNKNAVQLTTFGSHSENVANETTRLIATPQTPSLSATNT